MKCENVPVATVEYGPFYFFLYQIYLSGISLINIRNQVSFLGKKCIYIKYDLLQITVLLFSQKKNQ